MTKKANRPGSSLDVHYDYILGDISNVVDAAKRSAARSVNCIMTAAYWLVGRRIVESEQKGEIRAEYGDELIERLAVDLSARHGRGFSVRNVWQMKAFYLAWPEPRRLCLHNQRAVRFCRQCLQNPPFPVLPQASRFLGRPMSGCFR